MCLKKFSEGMLQLDETTPEHALNAPDLLPGDRNAFQRTKPSVVLCALDAVSLSTASSRALF